MKKPEAVSALKVLWMLVDFSGRVENLLKELRLVFQHGERGQETGPSERRPEPAQPDITSPPTSTPGAPPTGGRSTSTPRPEAIQLQPEPPATPVIPDPIRQEPIPDSLNTDDILSLHQWGMEGLRDSVTPTTGSQGPTDPVIRITPGSVIRSQQRQTGSVQTNLFGGTPDDPAARFRYRIRQLAAELRKQAEETRSGSEGKDDPAGEDEEDKDDEDEEEDEKEEEDPDSTDAYDSGDDKEDDDLPPASSHRLVTRSTPKKKPVSRPKRKAYRTQSGPGGSSR